MKDTVQLLSEAWPILISVVGLIAWLVRLESQVQAMRVEHEQLKTRHEALDSKVMEQLTQVRESLARIEGKLGVKV
jgi:hypothetical protein